MTVMIKFAAFKMRKISSYYSSSSPAEYTILCDSSTLIAKYVESEKYLILPLMDIQNILALTIENIGLHAIIII